MTGPLQDFYDYMDKLGGAYSGALGKSRLGPGPVPEIGSTVKLSPESARSMAEQMVRAAYTSKGEVPGESAGAMYNDLVARAAEDLQKGTAPEVVAKNIRTLVVGSAPDAALTRLGATPSTPGALGGVPEGWIVMSNGKWMNPVTGQVVDPTDKQIGGRTAAEEASSWAGAAANQAQADKIRADMERDKFIYDAIAAGELKETRIPGVFFTPDGKIVNKNDIDAQKIQAEVSRGTLDETRRRNLIDESIASRRADTEALGVRQTGEYQQGQLGIERSRLGLEQQKAQADIAAEQQRNALARQQYISKLLKEPSDFIASAYQQRGETSPNATITHADLINRINNDFANLQPGQVLPPPTPQLANGGTVRDRLMIVGDTQGPGQGIGNPEYVINPTGAPIGVVPMNRMAPQGRMNSYAEGTQKDPEVAAREAKVKGIAKLIQFVEEPSTQHRLVDELAEARGRLNKPGIPAYADGTPYTSTYFDPAGSKVQIQGAGVWGDTPAPGYTAAPQVSAPGPAQPAAPQRLAPVDSNPWGWNPVLAFNPARRLQSLPTNIVPGTREHLNWLQSYDTPAERIPPAETQEAIIQRAESAMPPAIRQLFGENFGKRLETQNTTPNPKQPLGVTPIRFPFGLFSPQQLTQLTDRELQALNSYLGVKYNTTLQDVLNAQQQVYAKPTGLRTGRLVQ